MFRDRTDAGCELAKALASYRDHHPVVLGVPRGGVVVGYEVAKALEAAFDVVLVRKLGVPYQPELGFGAIGENGVEVLDQGIVSRAGVTRAEIASVIERERRELDRRVQTYRGDRAPVDVAGRCAIIVDDGIATGVSIKAAAQAVRAAGASRIVIAAPVGPPASVARLFEVADDVVVVEQPTHLMAVGAWYRDFRQTEDVEVTDLLAKALHEPHHRTGPGSCRAASLTIPVGSIRLAGDLHIPDAATGLVVFAHGSGSSRHSPRNRFVASVLNAAGLGTLLFDLLTVEEEPDRRHVFDIDLLARRLASVVRWASTNADTRGLPVGVFGASTGAAAALAAATSEPELVRAVVSRGGRPDLIAPDHLAEVRAPTLLIVGGADHPVLEWNRQAAAHLLCEHEVDVVPGAGHLFEEPGALESVAHKAAGWFTPRLTESLISTSRP